MAGITENSEGHYEARVVVFGKVYEWHPEHIALECECGEKLVLTAMSTMTACCSRCGADLHGLLHDIKEREGHLPDRLTHPWFYDAKEWAEQHEESCDVGITHRVEGRLFKNVAQGSLGFGYLIGEEVS